MKLGIIEKAAVYPVQLSGNCDRNDLCTSAFYDHVCILQRREAGLVLCGGCQRSWGIQTAGIFYQ